MGVISLDKLFPKETRHRDHADPIARLGLPRKVLLMRCGFEMARRGGLFFEGETSAAVRFCERVWEYRQAPDTTKLHRARRWRIEFAVGINQGSIREGNVVVMAQEPYENAWLQRTSFRNYSKKSQEQVVPTVPDSEVLRRDFIEEPVEWLERNIKYDPWEANSRYVAGFSQPKGLHSARARNAAQDFVVGVCPDVDDLIARLYGMKEIRNLIRETESGKIVFWNRLKVKREPSLHPDVKNDCEGLMMISMQQALAGPRFSPRKWYDQPVWKLVGLIYRDHLNARNRSVTRRLGYQKAVDDVDHFTVEEEDRWRV